jgi:hypothetical protein
LKATYKGVEMEGSPKEVYTLISFMGAMHKQPGATQPSLYRSGSTFLANSWGTPSTPSHENPYNKEMKTTEADFERKPIFFA